ncbi:30S ribosomal protein S8 [Candidatus Woesearchaeota archaeon]|nr:30S ribosomal protein S8 [Candidatus Woesearchaeota archaeon]
MVMNDTLASALSKINNAEKRHKQTVQIFPSTKLLKQVLAIMQDTGYVGEFVEVKDSKGNYLTVNLIKRFNQCGAIKPRYTIKKDGVESFEKRYLPAKGFGYLIVSTPNGLMTHEQAFEKNIGGKLIAYFY